MESDLQLLLDNVDELLQKGHSKDEIMDLLKVNELPREHAKLVLSKIDDAVVTPILKDHSKGNSKAMYVSGLLAVLVGKIGVIFSIINGDVSLIFLLILLFGAWRAYEGYKEINSQEEVVKLTESKFKKKKFKIF